MKSRTKKTSNLIGERKAALSNWFSKNSYFKIASAIFLIFFIIDLLLRKISIASIEMTPFQQGYLQGRASIRIMVGAYGLTFVGYNLVKMIALSKNHYGIVIATILVIFFFSLGILLFLRFELMSLTF